jgi:hypothetical protein
MTKKELEQLQEEALSEKTHRLVEASFTVLKYHIYMKFADGYEGHLKLPLRWYPSAKILEVRADHGYLTLKLESDVPSTMSICPDACRAECDPAFAKEYKKEIGGD